MSIRLRIGLAKALTDIIVNGPFALLYFALLRYAFDAPAWGAAAVAIVLYAIWTEES